MRYRPRTTPDVFLCSSPVLGKLSGSFRMSGSGCAQISPDSESDVRPEPCTNSPVEPSWKESQSTLVLERVDTKQTLATISNWTTESNGRFRPYRTVGRLISKAGRKLERAFCVRLENLSVLRPTFVLHRQAGFIMKEDKWGHRHARVLLLGSPGSGRSEIVPLMRIVYKTPYTPEEAEIHRQLVFDYLMRGMLRILETMDKEKLALSEHNEPNAELVRCTGDLYDSPIALCDALSSLWNDPSVQAIQKRQDLFDPSFAYFFSGLNRIFDPSYVPVHEDIIHVEPRPDSPLETTFRYPRALWRITFTDTNQHMNKGFKWTSQLLDVKLIVLVIDLTVFNKYIPIEDRLVNQLSTAFSAWNSICNWEWPQSPTLILILNKYELFAHELKTCNINDHIPSYKGAPHDASAVVQYFTRYLRRMAILNGQRARIRVTDSMDNVSRRLLGLVIGELTREFLHGIALA